MTKYKLTAMALCFVLAVGMITAAADSDFEMTISAPVGASVGSTIYITIDISSLPKSLSAFECLLQFDPAVVQPVITSSGSNMNSFMAVNIKDFEQHCEYRGDGLYFLAFCTKNDGNGETAITDKSDLKIKIPFKIIAEGEFAFKIPQTSVLAFDTDLAAVSAKGCEYTFIALAKQNEFYAELKCAEALNNTATDLVFTVTNKTAADGIAAFEIVLEYSAATLKAQITDNIDDKMDAFMLSVPEGWQQMCSHTSDGKYHIRLVAPDGGISQSDCLAIGQSMTLSIPFNVVGAEGSKAIFKVSADECTAYANDLRLLTGAGSSLDIEIGKTPEFASADGVAAYIDGYITGIPADTAAKDIGKYLSGEVYVFYDGTRIGDDDIIATGMTAELWYHGQKMASAVVIIKGDVTCDGKVTVSDALLIKRVYFGDETLSQNAAAASKVITLQGAMPDDYFAVKRYIQGTYTFR